MTLPDQRLIEISEALFCHCFCWLPFRYSFNLRPSTFNLSQARHKWQASLDWRSVFVIWGPLETKREDTNIYQNRSNRNPLKPHIRTSQLGGSQAFPPFFFLNDGGFYVVSPGKLVVTFGKRSTNHPLKEIACWLWGSMSEVSFEGPPLFVVF